MKSKLSMCLRSSRYADTRCDSTSCAKHSMSAQKLSSCGPPLHGCVFWAWSPSLPPLPSRRGPVVVQVHALPGLPHAPEVLRGPAEDLAARRSSVLLPGSITMRCVRHTSCIVMFYGLSEMASYTKLKRADPFKGGHREAKRTSRRSMACWLCFSRGGLGCLNCY